MTGFRGNLKFKISNAQGELYPGGNMKKEYTLTVEYGKDDEECNEEEVIFTINNKDIICSEEMSKMILKLDNNILGLA